MARIVLDAMGSDRHPEPEIAAAHKAAAHFGDEITLVGPEERLASRITNPSVHLMHAGDVFEMAEHISADELRRSQNSMAAGIQMVKDGKADAFVTMGNTAGALATGLYKLGRIGGVKRPALTALFPVKGGRCVLLDIGANAECRPEYLVQFARMGAVYAEIILGVANPRIGLLSNGEEAGKGTTLVKETYPLLKASGLNFIGNVEGKELFGGLADVVVTDGFTGNVLLKSSEAVAKLLIDTLREELYASARTKIGGLLARPAFNRIRKLLDPADIGAVPLLGLGGLVFVGHGRSDERAVFNAVRMARQAVEGNLLVRLQSALAMEPESQVEVVG